MWLQIVTVITVARHHGRLTRRFRVILEGFEQVLFEFLHLLESFLFQVAERSSTCSSTPCVGVTLWRVSFLGVTLRAVCLVTDVGEHRDLLRLSDEGLGGSATFLARGLSQVNS